MNDLYQCGTCGHAERMPETSVRAGEGAPCGVCGAPFDGFKRIDYSSGYDQPHLLNVWVRAPSLELVAGCGDPEEGMRRALDNAIANPADADALRDAAAFIETQLHGLNVAALNRTPTERAADELEAAEWFSPAGDIRDGVPPDTVIGRVQKMTDDEDELGRALPILERLAGELDE